MTVALSHSPTLLKGALITLTDTALIPVPGYIPFQYNPNTVSRDFEPYTPPAPAHSEDTTQPDPTDRAQPGPPTERISLTLELDATNYLEDPGNNPVGSVFGVAPAIASMEKIMYPTGYVVGALIDAIGGLLSTGDSSAVPRSEVPIVLFFWGPSRLLPVRITSMRVEDQGHSPVLYPTLATVALSMKVLTPAAFERQRRAGLDNVRALSLAEKLAIAAYEYTSLNRDLLSYAGIVDTVAGIIPD